MLLSLYPRLQTIIHFVERFGWRVVRDVFQWGKEAELQKPYLVQVDGWGRYTHSLLVISR